MLAQSAGSRSLERVSWDSRARRTGGKLGTVSKQPEKRYRNNKTNETGSLVSTNGGPYSPHGEPGLGKRNRPRVIGS